MKSHEVDYQVYGDDLQFVEIELDASETVIAEAGAMMYMEDGITFETKMGDGSKPDQGFLGALGSVAKRAITGESIFMTHFSNSGQGKKTRRLWCPLPRQNHRHRPGRGQRRADLPEGFLPLRRAGHRGEHRLQQKAGRRPLWRRGVHFAAAAG